MYKKCENCKNSYLFGNKIWSLSKLKCKKGYDISLVEFDRSVNKKYCNKYENRSE